MSRIVTRLTLAVCMLVLTSGCWDTKDINKRYMPAVIGIGEGGEAKYRIVLQIPSISGKTQILEKESNSISKAIDLLRTDAEKSIDLVHMRLFLISEDKAKSGINDIINYALRANDISVKGMVAIVTGDFKKTMYHQITPTPEVSSYDYFSEESGWTPNVSLVRIWEAYRSIHSYTQDMAIPMLTAGKDTLFSFQGSAIMRGDRMVGVLSPRETLFYNIFKGKYTGGTIEVAQDTSVIIKNAQIRHRKQWTNNGPELVSDIRMDTVVVESPPGKSDEKIERAIEQSLNDSAAAVVDKLQQLNADALGTGLIFRPKLTKSDDENWKSKWFPKLKHVIQVRVNVQSDLYFKEHYE